MDTHHDHVDELTLEEIAAEPAEALPERAAMSTLNVTSLDTAGAAIEAVGDGAPDASAPETIDPAPLPSETAATPAEHGPPASVPGAEHSAASEHVPAGT